MIEMMCNCVESIQHGQQLNDEETKVTEGKSEKTISSKDKS
jgi:hypothetical protein